MTQRPLRLLLTGYGLAAAGGGVALAAGWPLWGALLLLWFGGAAAVLVLAAAPPTARFFRGPARDQDAEDRALLESLAQWEADRLADRPKRDAPARSADAG